MSIYTMGIDVGSTASKCVILKDGGEIVAKSLVAVGTGTSGPSRAIAQVLENAGMTREQMDFVLATGYGRNSLDGLADMQMSELSCHAKGAAFLFRVYIGSVAAALWQTVLLPEILFSVLAYPLFYLGAWAVSRIGR